MVPPESPPIAVGLAAVVALVLANAFFVAAEFALVGARKTRLDEMARTGDRRAKLARRAIGSLDRYISPTQLGITLASLALGWIGEPAVAGLIHGAFSWLPEPLSVIATHGVASAIAFIIITVLHIILGELVPKALALLFPEQVSRWVAAPLVGFAWAMSLPIAVLNGIANRLLRLLGVQAPTESERLHSPDEIRMLVAQSSEGGSLLREEARLLEGVFEFSEKTAQEVMTPRTGMAALHADLTLDQSADEVAIHGRSRYPVYTESLDDIIGVVHAKDIFARLRRRPTETLRSVVRAPLFVPGTRDVEDVLADMKRLKTHMAVVLDEYGGTAGLVTLEDLLEEIVGPIYDEHDVQARPVTDEQGTLIDGSMPISHFNPEFGADLDDTDYTTVGGLIFGQLGRLPRVGDRVTAGLFTFEVVEMQGRRIERLRLHRAAGEEAVYG
jgi:CBS domain containing-hemolysin-like protein